MVVSGYKKRLYVSKAPSVAPDTDIEIEPLPEHDSSMADKVKLKSLSWAHMS